MQKLTLALIAASMIGVAAIPSHAAPPSQERTFATRAAQSGLAEVEAGQLAAQRATSPRVKQFGQTLVEDHTQANQQLQQVAEQENLTLPSEPSATERAQLQKLRGLSGQEFDKAFVQDQIRNHQQAIAQFAREARSGKDEALKAFAHDTVPVLQKHLQMAQALAGNG